MSTFRPPDGLDQLTESDARAIYARMGPDERAVMKELLEAGDPGATNFARVFAYFPSVRLATEEELARQEFAEEIDLRSARGAGETGGRSTTRTSATSEETVDAPVSRSSAPAAEALESTSRAGTQHLRFIAGKIYCPFRKQRLDLGDDHVYGSAFDCPSCGQHVAARPMAGRENVEDKGRRLLTEGRLTVTHVSDSTVERAPIQATCKGDSGEIYNLGYDANAHEWRCTCQARGNCAHLVALKLVTVKP